MSDVAMVYTEEQKASAPVVDEQPKKPYWNVVTCSLVRLEDQLNILRAQKYHVFKIFQSGDTFAILSHRANHNYDVNKILQNTKKIVDLLQKKAATK